MSVEAVKWALYEAPMLLTPAGRPDTTARSILVVFAEHADQDGRNAFPGPARIKFATGYDVRTVERAVRRLEDGKLLERQGLTSQGAVRWRVNMAAERPPSDWEEIEAELVAEREAGAARVRKHRGARPQAAPVTDAECVTEPVVTDAECVTSSPVTHSASVRNALEVRYVTHSVPGEPPIEPPGTTIGGTLPPDPLRTNSPQAARWTEQATAPDRSKTLPTQLGPESPVPSATAARDRHRLGETSWRRQRKATENLDPDVRAAVREELDARRRRALIHAVPDAVPDESSGAAS